MLNTLLKKYPRAIPVGFLILAILVSFWKLTTMRGILITDDIFTGDMANGHLPYFHFLGESLKHGELPLWIPTIYSGFPFVGGGAGHWYPLNTLLFWLLPTFMALNLTLLLTLVIAAVGMFFYAREIGADLPGSLIAAISFAFSGFMISHLKHVTMVQSVCWAPLGLAIIERSIAQSTASGTRSGVRILVWLAPVFALQSLSGFTQTVYYSGLLYGLYFLFRLFNRQRALAMAGPRRAAPPKVSALLIGSIKSPLILWFIGVMAVGSAMSAVQLFPTFDLVAQSDRTGGVTYEYATHFGYDPRDASMFVYPLANGDIGNGTYSAKGIFWEDYGYVGIFTLLLAVFGIVRGRKTWHVRFLLGTAILAFLLVLGKHSFVYDLAFNAIPGMSYFRFSARFLFIVDICLAALAAIGTTSLGEILSGKRGKVGEVQKVSTIGLFLVGVVFADLLYFQMRQNAIIDAETWRRPPHTVQKILSDPGMFRVYSPAASETHKVAWRLANGWQGDLQPYVDQREFLQVNSNVLYGIASPEVYIQLAPSNVVDIWGDMNRGGMIMSTATVQQGKFNARASFNNIMNLFNVKYILAPWPIEGTSIRIVEQTNGVYVHENPGVLPRAFMVGRVREAHTLPAASGILLSSDFDPAREVILPEPLTLQLDTNQAASRVEVLQYRNNEVQLKVSAAGSGVLVLSDTYFPGWSAELDGTEVPIMKANLCQRAVAVPAGMHVLRFVFRPRSFMFGSLVTGLSIIIFLVAVVLMRKRGG
jgi:hypothetical protein